MPVQPPQKRTETTVGVPSSCDHPVSARLEPGPRPSRQGRIHLISALHRPPIEEHRAIKTQRHLGMLSQPHYTIFRKRRPAAPALHGLLHALILNQQLSFPFRPFLDPGRTAARG